MSDYNQQNAEPRKRTPFDEFRLRVSAKPIEQGLKPPSLKFDVYQNNANFRVYTNENGDAKPIYAGMDLFSFLAVSETIMDFANDKRQGHVDVICRTGSPRELTIACKVRIGKDEQGCLFISVLAKDRPPIKFIFGPSIYHDIVDGSGEPIGKAALSIVYGKVFAKTSAEMVINWLAANPSQEVPNFNKDDNKGGGGGWQGGKKQWNGNKGNYNGGKKQWNNNNQGGGGYKKPWQGGQKKPWQGNNNNQGGGQQQGGQQGGQKSGGDGWSDDFPM